jgi:hypothetical protein
LIANERSFNLAHKVQTSIYVSVAVLTTLFVELFGVNNMGEWPPLQKDRQGWFWSPGISLGERQGVR